MVREQSIIATTTNHWANNAKTSLENQSTPLIKIDLQALKIVRLIGRNGSQTKNKTLIDAVSERSEAVEKVCASLATADRGKLIVIFILKKYNLAK